ncbi:hypothetical protein PTTG_04784 [Puccinia triticina 1-1 BBBD Race 1]|uniref:Uncharacterized protein n=1 Tax=Puccinia triticina (isolate 1-1 / race 1 (BBBD)) TaxID=630390 RepID=A0A0C4EVF1_PUCT1|nr:hypothetical protein PTTG_04784 [Puccinia triticina 1-1 BBBD Race 1]
MTILMGSRLLPPFIEPPSTLPHPPHPYGLAGSHSQPHLLNSPPNHQKQRSGHFNALFFLTSTICSSENNLCQCGESQFGSRNVDANASDPRKPITAAPDPNTSVQPPSQEIPTSPGDELPAGGVSSGALLPSSRGSSTSKNTGSASGLPAGANISESNIPPLPTPKQSGGAPLIQAGSSDSLAQPTPAARINGPTTPTGSSSNLTSNILPSNSSSLPPKKTPTSPPSAEQSQGRTGKPTDDQKTAIVVSSVLLGALLILGVALAIMRRKLKKREELKRQEEGTLQATPGELGKRGTVMVGRGLESSHGLTSSGGWLDSRSSEFGATRTLSVSSSSTSADSNEAELNPA